MKKLTLLILAILLLTSSAFAEEPQLIKDRMDEINYSLGHQFGQQFVRDQVEFRPQVLWQGIYDAVNKAQPFLSQEQMSLILEELKNPTVAPEAPAAAAEVKIEPQTAPPPKPKPSTQPQVLYRLKGQKFLAENQKKDKVQSLPSGVQYKILKQGDGEKPTEFDSVMVTYRAYDIDGKEFDSSYPLGIPTPAEFRIDQLIPGLAEVLPMMQVGAKWEIYIPYMMAYRDSGPMAGQTVIYDLELLEILPEFR